VGEAREGLGMIPFMPRDRSAGDRERVKVRRLSVPAWPLSGLRPSELEAADSRLGGQQNTRECDEGFGKKENETHLEETAR
jgi:hypothetical protein